MDILYAYMGPSLLIATVGITASGVIVATTLGFGWMAFLFSVARWIRHDSRPVTEAVAHVLEAGAQAAGREAAQVRSDDWHQA